MTTISDLRCFFQSSSSFADVSHWNGQQISHRHSRLIKAKDTPNEPTGSEITTQLNTKIVRPTQRERERETETETTGKSVVSPAGDRASERVAAAAAWEEGVQTRKYHRGRRRRSLRQETAAASITYIRMLRMNGRFGEAL